VNYFVVLMNCWYFKIQR